MGTDAKDLRITLSANLKKHREFLGLTQEKLAEKAGLSANMVNDIEGYRSWVSDKTLANLASALDIEPFRLFLPPSFSDNDIAKTALTDLAQDIQQIRKDFNSRFDEALKTRGLKK